MRVSLTQISRAISFVVLIVAVLAVPVNHGVHDDDAADNDCRLCQLRHSTIGIASEVQAVVDCFESAKLTQGYVVDSFNSQHQLTSGSRAPPA